MLRVCPPPHTHTSNPLSIYLGPHGAKPFLYTLIIKEEKLSVWGTEQVHLTGISAGLPWQEAGEWQQSLRPLWLCHAPWHLSHTHLSGVWEWWGTTPQARCPLATGWKHNHCLYLRFNRRRKQNQTHRKDLLSCWPAPLVTTSLGLLRAPSPLVVYAATVME